MSSHSNTKALSVRIAHGILRLKGTEMAVPGVAQVLRRFITQTGLIVEKVATFQVGNINPALSYKLSSSPHILQSNLRQQS